MDENEWFRGPLKRECGDPVRESAFSQIVFPIGVALLAIIIFCWLSVGCGPLPGTIVKHCFFSSHYSKAGLYLHCYQESSICEYERKDKEDQPDTETSVCERMTWGKKPEWVYWQ